MTTLRSNCWSITINNPNDKDLNPQLPAGWSQEGQIERGEEGIEHYQGMLRTPQVRFSAVKKVFPRAHIEIARNPLSLKKYVHKEETRVAECENRYSDIPTLFDYQGEIVKKWDHQYFDNKVRERRNEWAEGDMKKPFDYDEVFMEYLDELVGEDICAGKKGVEFIAINPLWRSSWKKFGRQILVRYSQTDRQTDDDEKIEVSE